MTGYQSKKTAALDEEGMYLVHQTAQPAQEPWPDLTKRDRESYRKGHDAGVAHHKQAVKAALAQPAQRPWVDLTEDQIKTIEEKALTKQWAIRMTIAQLKECNA